jgi:hypothetical protein
MAPHRFDTPNGEVYRKSLKTLRGVLSQTLIVEHANKVVIRDNDVRIHPDLPKTQMNTPVLDVTPDSTGVTIVGNIVHALPDKYGSGWSVTGNTVVSRYGQTTTSSGTAKIDSGASGETSTPTAEAAGGTDFRFIGSKITGTKTVTLSDVDFADGDRIILQDFVSGTLDGWGGGNPRAVNSAGTYAVLDSLTDIKELAGASGARVDTSILSTADTLVIDIDPNSGGSLEIRLPATDRISWTSDASHGRRMFRARNVRRPMDRGRPAA